MRTLAQLAVVAVTLVLAGGPALRSPAEATPVSQLPGAIAAGGGHTCAVTSGGAVKCWGANDNGQLGDGTTFARNVPVDVASLSSGVRAVAAGLSHSCALGTNGRLKCWGENRQGQLGDGTTTGRTRAVDVSGLASGVAAVAAGYAHTCALTAAGGIKCWGNNSFGQLGDGEACGEICLTPVDAAGLTEGVSAIAAAGYYTCALTRAGGVRCWGDNTFGQLGDGTTTDRNTPVAVIGLSSGTTAITAGADGHTCAVSEAGALRCWGNNEFGQLGEDRSCPTPCVMPVDVQELAGPAMAAAGGYFFTCALTSTAALQCWGSNDFGQLGDDGVCGSLCGSPVDVVGLESAAGIAAGLLHACAATTDGAVFCWGDNFDGQLGDGGACGTRCATPVEVPAFRPSSLGDVNCDDRADSVDAALVLQLVAGLVTSLPCGAVADVNGDTRINAVDAAILLQYSAGLLRSLPP